MAAPLPSGPEAVRAAHARLTGAFTLDAVPPVAARRDALRRLRAAVGAARDDLLAALDADFGPRAEVESLTAELILVRDALAHAARDLPRWAAPRRARVLKPLPGRTEVWAEPKGAVAILSPWNYPVQLALMPLVGALAAGNRVLLKPSERAPASAEALARLVADTFAPDEVAAVTGDVETARAVTALPWAHLFYTGSTAVGREVARRAAETLTPVTLELGGRSPAVALPGATPARHAPAVAWGAFLNGGQTCVACDHLWVPRDRMEEWAEALLTAARGVRGRDRTAPIDARAAERARALRDDAVARGATLRSTDPDDPLAPALLLDPPAEADVMGEEVFAPLLPVIPYDDPEAAVAANRGETPLAAYAFDDDPARARALLARLRSGGGAVNAAVVQIVAGDLPFGGIGTSGQGAYHGRRGFREFSHERAVFVAARGPWARLMAPPYPAAARRLFRRLAGG